MPGPARPDDGAVRQRPHAVEAGDRGQLGQVLPARVVLARPDGARVVSASQLSLKMAAISELAMSTLVARGLPLHRARLLVLTVERFTIGHALEEQSQRPDPDEMAGFGMAAFAARHPTMIAGITDYFQPGRTVDDLFRDCLELIINPGVVTSEQRSDARDTTAADR